MNENACGDVNCGIHYRVQVRATGYDDPQWMMIDYVGKYGVVTLLTEDAYYYTSMLLNGTPADAYTRVYLVGDGPLIGRDEFLKHREDISVPLSLKKEGSEEEIMDAFVRYVSESHNNVLDMVKAGKIG